MDTRILFALAVLAYAGFPIMLAYVRSPMRLVFLYVYIGMVHVLGGFMGAVVSLPVASDITISGGSLAYGAFMMTTVVLLVVGQELQVLRNVIKLVVVTNAVKFAIFSLTRAALEAPGHISPFDTSPEVFSVSLRVIAAGGLLIILELLFLVWVLERVKTRVQEPLALSLPLIGLFIGILCLDGVLFPLLALPVDATLGSVIATGVKAKLVLACAFSVPLTIFLLLFRKSVAQYEATPFRLTELFVAPREELVEEIGRQKKELAAREENYLQLAESIEDVLFSLDGEMRVTYWNGAAERTGYRREDVLGRRYEEAFPATELLGFFDQVIASQSSGRTSRTIERDDGEVTYEISAFPYKDGVSVLARDVTESRRLQAELLQAQKMEAVGQLAGGVAHDFNNLLAVITSSAALALEDLPPGSATHNDVEEVLKASHRAAALVMKLLSFSRPAAVLHQVLALDTVVSEMGGLFERTIPESVRLKMDLASHASIEMDRSQLEHAILNIVVNARDAMPSGGDLTITTSTTRVDEEAAVQINLLEGEYALLEITDTGHGMTEEIVGRIFEPFFTTKHPGAGTGLGLSGAYAAISQAGGLIRVASRPNQGTTFQVYLPTSQRTAGPGSAEQPHRHPDTANVLVVDDEQSIATIVVRILERDGHTVTATTSPEKALRLLESGGSPIDLLLTDVVMPGMSGNDLAERGRSINPELKVLFMSGYPHEVQRQHGFSPDAELVMKPFTIEELRAAIARCLQPR